MKSQNFLPKNNKKSLYPPRRKITDMLDVRIRVTTKRGQNAGTILRLQDL